MNEDILKALVQYYHDRVEAFEVIEDFLEDILHNPKQVIDEMQELIHDDSIENSICPICRKELLPKTEIRNLNSPTNEYQYIKYCKSCGWTSENE